MLSVEYILNQLRFFSNDEVVHVQVNVFAREPLLHVKFFAILLVNAGDHLHVFKRLTKSNSLQTFNDLHWVLSALGNLDGNVAFVKRQLALPSAKVTIVTPFAEDRLHSKAKPVSFSLYRVVTVHLIDDGLEVSWVHRSGCDNDIFSLFFESIDSCSGVSPLWIVEIPFLIAESSFYLVETLLAWGIVKADCSKFE